MQAQDSLSFETEADKQIYKYVERHGTATRNATRKEASLGPEEFQERLERLKTRGYLAEDGGTLSLGLDIGSIEHYETDVFEYTIRPGRPEDFEGLVDAIREVTSEESYVIAESVAEELLYEDTVNRHNTVESRMFFVASVDESIIGWTHLDLPQVDKLRNTARQTVGVVPAYRGQGVGTRLLQRGIDWAGANGYRKMHNNVPAVNEHALAFLERHGWQTEGIRRKHYTLGDELVDEVMMAYEIE
ncbi:N-acetyltransferase family protein [Halobacteriales archaeon Cl-PHB]